MAEPEYDDTDMTPEEFEERMAAGLPAHVSASREDPESVATPMVIFVEESSNTAGDRTADVMTVGAIGQFALVVDQERDLANAG